MKKWTLLCLSALLGSALTARADSLTAQAPPAAPASSGVETGRVLKDRVNVRARPDTKEEVVTQLNAGDRVEILESKDKWLRVRLPEAAKCYVSAKLIQNGAVAGDAVNVRCGPGTNHRVVGQLAKGEKIAVVETKGEWTQIKPTATCSAWIAADLVEVAPPPAPPVITETIEVVTPPVAVPEAAPMIQVVETEVRVQYVVKDGFIKPVAETDVPAAYQLMTENVDGREYRIAYLETTEKNLQRYVGRHVRVLGNQRWTKGERYPVIVVDRIDIVW